MPIHRLRPSVRSSAQRERELAREIAAAYEPPREPNRLERTHQISDANLRRRAGRMLGRRNY